MTSNLLHCMLALAATVCASAQEVWHLDDVSQQVQYGTRVVRLGDVNADGWDDVIELGLGRSGPGAFFRQELRVVSGRDGTTLSIYPTPATLDATGQYILVDHVFVPESLAATGDMDLDQVPDYAVSGYDYVSGITVPQNHVLEVRSGLDHHLIWSASVPNGWTALFGWTIAGQLDIDGDGLMDVVTSATRLSPGGTVIAYDHWGTELYRVVNPDYNFLFGVDLAPLGGDLDGDGCDDYLAGSPWGQDQGAVLVMSGRNGSILRTSFGTQPFDKLSEVTGCGDLDGDGVLDYAGGGMWGASVVTTFSGATGQAIHSYRPNFANQSGVGYHVTSGFDCDQDGVNDLVASSLSPWGHIMSGRDGTLIASLGSVMVQPGDERATELTLLRAPPGEQYPLLVYYSGTLTQTSYFTRLVARRLLPTGVQQYGVPDASAASPLARMGMRDLPGPQIRFTLSSAPPGAFVAFAVGFSDTVLGGAPLPLPLDPIGFDGITLLTSTDLSWTGWAGTTGVNAGYVELDALAGLRTSGAPLFAQWLWLDLADWTKNGSTAAHAFRIQ